MTFSFCKGKIGWGSLLVNCGDFEYYLNIVTNSVCYQQNQKLSQRQKKSKSLRFFKKWKIWLSFVWLVVFVGLG